MGDTKVLMYVSGATAVLNLVLNVALIPVYGIVGAAIATLGSTLLNNGIQAFYVYSKTGIQPLNREMLIPIGLSLACMVGFEIVFSSNNISFVTSILITGVSASLLIIFIILTRSVYLIELKLADSVLNMAGIQLDLQNRLRCFTKN
jgi:O-antigen/teichoic acid export membrane protein